MLGRAAPGIEAQRSCYLASILASSYVHMLGLCEKMQVSSYYNFRRKLQWSKKRMFSIIKKNYANTFSAFILRRCHPNQLTTVHNAVTSRRVCVGAASQLDGNYICSPKARRVVLKASSMCRLHTYVVSTGRLSGVDGL